MRLLARLKKQPAISDSEVGEIQERVRSMREQVGNREIELADLFALLGEDERPLLRVIDEVKRPEIERIWPDQIPEREAPPEEARVPKTTYGDWELLRRKGLVTLP